MPRPSLSSVRQGDYNFDPLSDVEIFRPSVEPSNSTYVFATWSLMWCSFTARGYIVDHRCYGSFSQPVDIAAPSQRCGQLTPSAMVACPGQRRPETKAPYAITVIYQEQASASGLFIHWDSIDGIY